MSENNKLPSDLQELIARAEQDQKDQKEEKKKVRRDKNGNYHKF